MIGNSKEMIAKMKGPALVVALPFQPVSRPPSLTDEEKIHCSVPSCHARFGTVKAFKKHLWSQHPDEAER